MKTLLVTGAAGFIGGHFIQTALNAGYAVIAVDKLTYAGDRELIQKYLGDKKIVFFQDSILSTNAMRQIFKNHRPNAVVNFAAESHVDNSINSPKIFLETNVQGVFNLLEVARDYFSQLNPLDQSNFRFLQVSTDEVFGALSTTGQFSEESRYSPNSPYAASKAAADHFVRAWNHTYGLPTIITHSSNNYGPRQWPEKLIPTAISNAIQKRTIKIYGSGTNVRDWIHVEDHCAGILLALECGRIGESYCFGGNCELTNINVVQSICNYLDQVFPEQQVQSYSSQIQFVTDRLGHDFRYSIDISKAVRELGFKIHHTNFEQGLRATIQWYLANQNYFEKKKTPAEILLEREDFQ